MAEESKEAQGGDECPKCEGRGKYYDKSRHLVAVKCEECGGSGKASK